MSPRCDGRGWGRMRVDRIQILEGYALFVLSVTGDIALLLDLVLN
jgi:hypothetical protein